MLSIINYIFTYFVVLIRITVECSTQNQLNLKGDSMSKKIADLLEDIKRADEFGIENCHSPALQYEFSRKTHVQSCLYDASKILLLTGSTQVFHRKQRGPTPTSWGPHSLLFLNTASRTSPAGGHYWKLIESRISKLSHASIKNSGSYPTVKVFDMVLRILRKCLLFLSNGQMGVVQCSNPNFL